MMAEVVKLNPKLRAEGNARTSGGAEVRDFPDREREVENERLDLLADWLAENEDWLFELVLERSDEPFRDHDHLSEWVQLNWEGSETFSGAPREGLRWQAANDLLFHCMEGAEYDLEALRPE